MQICSHTLLVLCYHYLHSSHRTLINYNTTNRYWPQDGSSSCSSYRQSTCFQTKRLIEVIWTQWCSEMIWRWEEVSWRFVFDNVAGNRRWFWLVRFQSRFRVTELSNRRGNSFSTIRCTTMIWATGAPVATIVLIYYLTKNSKNNSARRAAIKHINANKLTLLCTLEYLASIHQSILFGDK